MLRSSWGLGRRRPVIGSNGRRGRVSSGHESTASLVDRVSFDFMREHEIRTAFAFDRDFVREGFTLLD
jgi:hypothetical protein